MPAGARLGPRAPDRATYDGLYRIYRALGDLLATGPGRAELASLARLRSSPSA